MKTILLDSLKCQAYMSITMQNVGNSTQDVQYYTTAVNKSPYHYYINPNWQRFPLETSG